MLGFGESSSFGCVRVLLSVGGWCRAARRTSCHTQTWKGVSSGGDGRKFREMAGARVLVACSGFGACAHVVGRLVRVDVAGSECDLRAGPRDKEAAALPEK